MSQPTMIQPERPQPIVSKNHNVVGQTSHEITSLEGYLEYAVLMSPETKRDSNAPPVPHGEDEERLHVPENNGPQPPSDQLDQVERERRKLLNLPNWKKRALFGCSCVLQFLLQFDMAAVAVTIPEIAKALDAPQAKVFALATGYLLAQTVFQLVFSHVSHAAGRKLMFIAGLLLFLAGAGTAAGAPPIEALVGARVVQGVGAAGMYTMSAIVIVEMTQPRQRAGWTSISSAFGAVGNICGPLVAGLMNKRLGFHWSSIFIVEAVISVLLFVALVILLPGESRGHRERLRELRDCDWMGMFCFFVCSVAILVPINIGGTTNSLRWGSLPVVTCFVVGVISLSFLIYHQRCLAKRPAFPREIFVRPAAGVAFFGSAVCGVLLSMVFYHLVIFWKGIRHKSTVEVGKALLSVTIAYPMAFAITGIAIKRWGRIKYATAAGAVLSTLGLGLMQLMTEDTPEAALLVICAIAGAGCGILMPAMVNAVIATTDSRWHPHAMATRTLLYTAGQCVGVSLGLAIFSAAFSSRFTAVEGEEAQRATAVRAALRSPQELLSKLDELSKLSPNGEVIRMVVGALRAVWAFACVLAGVTGAAAILMRFPDLAEDRTTQGGSSDEERQENSTEMTTR